MATILFTTNSCHYFYVGLKQNIMRVQIFLATILVAISINGCKKAEQKVKETLLTNLITGNVWVVTRFDSAANSIQPYFESYEFKFNKDGTVNAVKADVIEASGTWLGSEAGESITSSFPTAAYPINKLAGIWLVTNTDLTPKLVDAHRFEGLTEYVLRLNAK
jgi:hypothetical protein